MNMPLKDESQSSQGTSSTLATSVMEALSNFVPGEKFLRQNEHTILGLNIEGECILDSKCVALQLSSHAQGQPLPANFSRYLIIVELSFILYNSFKRYQCLFSELGLFLKPL